MSFQEWASLQRNDASVSFQEWASLRRNDAAAAELVCSSALAVAAAPVDTSVTLTMPRQSTAGPQALLTDIVHDEPNVRVDLEATGEAPTPPSTPTTQRATDPITR